MKSMDIVRDLQSLLEGVQDDNASAETLLRAIDELSVQETRRRLQEIITSLPISAAQMPMLKSVLLDLFHTQMAISEYESYVSEKIDDGYTVMNAGIFGEESQGEVWRVQAISDGTLAMISKHDNMVLVGDVSPAELLGMLVDKLNLLPNVDTNVPKIPGME